jgi:hypothetical protein
MDGLTLYASCLAIMSSVYVRPAALVKYCWHSVSSPVLWRNISVRSNSYATRQTDFKFHQPVGGDP